MRVVAEVLVGDIGKARQQEECQKPPLFRTRAAQEDDRQQGGQRAAEIGRRDEGAREVERGAGAHVRGRHRRQIAEIGRPVADAAPGGDARRDDEAGGGGGQKHPPLVAQKQGDEDGGTEGDRVGDLDHHEPGDAETDDGPVDERPGGAERFQHRQCDRDEGQRPGPAVVMHRDRDGVDGLAMHEGRDEHEADKAERVGQKPRKPGQGRPPDQRQQRRGDAGLCPVYRLVDPHSGGHEGVDREEGEGTDRRHEVEMRGLAALEPEEDFQKVQHVALVAGDVEPALEKRERRHTRDEGRENGQEDNGIWSAHPSELPFFGHIRR